MTRLEMYQALPTTDKKPAARIFPEKIGSTLLSTVLREGLGSSAEKPIEVLSDNEEDVEERKEEPDITQSSLLFGRQESYNVDDDSDLSSATQLQGD